MRQLKGPGVSKAWLKPPTRQATIMLLVKKGEVLLAMKKRGFGVGKWNGVGGKSLPEEDIMTTAIRETQEEISVVPLNLKKVAVLNFYFPLMPSEKNWNQQVSVFTSKKWKGTPLESEEMKPQWFKFEDIPYSEMWSDDEVWLPKVLAGKKVQGDFVFGRHEKLIDHRLKEVSGFIKVNDGRS